MYQESTVFQQIVEVERRRCLSRSRNYERLGHPIDRTKTRTATLTGERGPGAPSVPVRPTDGHFVRSSSATAAGRMHGEGASAFQGECVRLANELCGTGLGNPHKPTQLLGPLFAIFA